MPQSPSKIHWAQFLPGAADLTKLRVHCLVDEFDNFCQGKFVFACSISQQQCDECLDFVKSMDYSA